MKTLIAAVTAILITWALCVCMSDTIDERVKSLRQLKKEVKQRKLDAATWRYKVDPTGNNR